MSCLHSVSVQKTGELYCLSDEIKHPIFCNVFKHYNFSALSIMVKPLSYAILCNIELFHFPCLSKRYQKLFLKQKCKLLF